MTLRDFLNNHPNNTLIRKGENIIRKEDLKEEDFDKEVYRFELIPCGGVAYIED